MFYIKEAINISRSVKSLKIFKTKIFKLFIFLVIENNKLETQKQK